MLKLISAPAKINLFLHITGQRKDSYHRLQSLITFTNLKDEIEIKAADQLSLSINNSFSDINLENNLITKAAKKISNLAGRNLNLSIHVNKNIPIGAGLGGGSADAAAIVRGLLDYWDTEVESNELDKILLSLGADVPVCYYQESAVVQGIGENITPIELPHKIPAILIYPNEFCSTEDIFESYNSTFSAPVTTPSKFNNKIHLYEFLNNQRNDLTEAACQEIPVIKDVLNITSHQNGCSVSRMSGSGSACFGLFNTIQESETAAQTIQKERPNWWVRPLIIQ